jgi:hypothetical protein
VAGSQPQEPQSLWETRLCATSLEEMEHERYISAGEMAVAYAGLGEIELAFEALFRAVEERSISLVLSKVDPQLDALRADPRFAALLRKINLP